VSFEQLVLLMVKLHFGNSSHGRDCFQSPSRFGTCKVVHCNFRSSLISFFTALVLIYFLHNVAPFALIVNENQEPLLCHQCGGNFLVSLDIFSVTCDIWDFEATILWVLYAISCRLLVSKMHQFLSPVLHGVPMEILWVCNSS
jgi:hypothetical protein